MSLNIFRRSRASSVGLLTSKLFDETTFYSTFQKDLRQCRREAIIESPFITGNRVAGLLPIFGKMRSLGVRITINTRDPQEHDGRWRFEAEEAIRRLQGIGIQVLFTDNHHRKLAVMDEMVLWEGSLNILSQNSSCEIMRRIESEELAKQMVGFVKIGKFL